MIHSLVPNFREGNQEAKKQSDYPKELESKGITQKGKIFTAVLKTGKLRERFSTFFLPITQSRPASSG